jgi:hypothetical protein
MGKPSAHRASAVAMMKGAKTLKKVCNNTWKLAPKAPMFTRKSKAVAGKKKVVRTKRLIGGHAYKIVASGGAAYASAVLGREASVFRTSIDSESKRVPWLPSVSPGAIAIIEQFLCAYAQDATRHAVSVRQGLGRMDKTKGKWIPLFARLNGKLMKVGYDQADQQIFGSAMPAPRNLYIAKPDAKSTKKEGKAPPDDDYQPAPEAE